MARRDKLSRVFSMESSGGDAERLPSGNRSETTGKPAPFGLNRYAAEHLKKPNSRYIQEIDPELIESAGPADRMDEIDEEAERALRESILKTGQTTPVLLRPDPASDGRFRIIYGRRRVRALKALGQPVKAIVRDDITEEDAVVIQGQENSVRKDLSFLERARFLVAIEAEGFPRAVAIDALAIDKARASNYAKLGNTLPDPIARLIGPAPGIGRNRWLEFVSAYEVHPDADAVLIETLTALDPNSLNSDARFGVAIERLKDAGPIRPQTMRRSDDIDREIAEGEGKGKVTFARVKSKKGALTVNVPARSKEQREFAAHLSKRIDDMIREELDRWRRSGGSEN